MDDDDETAMNIDGLLNSLFNIKNLPIKLILF
jgi:hypothetical protein